MFLSIVSLLLIVLPGYSLFHISWICNKTNFNNMEKFLFGFTIWIFYIVSTIMIMNIIFPNYLNYIYWFNYLLGFILVGYFFYIKIPRFLLNLSKNYKIKLNLMNITRGGSLLFLLFMITFLFIITFYTPIIYQYDALAWYLPEGRQFIKRSSYLSGTWPTFGDTMPVMPIIYSWFYYLSDTPLIRLIPFSFLFLIILLVYTLGIKLSPTNIYVAHISVISLVSMTSLQWYMAKTSLYLDIGFIFLAATSLYALLLTLENKSTQVNFLILGINLSILTLSKEFGIFQAWFIIVFLFFSRFKEIINNRIKSWILSISLLLPFLMYYLIFKIIFSFYNIDTSGNIMPFRFFIVITFLFLFKFTFTKINFEVIKFSLFNVILFIIPLFVPIIFIINNLYVIGVPFGTLKEPYVQSLLKLGIIFGYWKPPLISLHSVLDIFFTHTIMNINLVPFIIFIIVILIPTFLKKINWISNLLALWFFYSLFIFYFISYGTLNGGMVRRILPMAIPMSLMVGKGVHYLVSYKKWSNKVNLITYMSANSLSLAYLWFIKFDITKWWFKNLNSLIQNNKWISYIEFFIYTIPWFLLIILMKKSNSRFSRLKRSGKKVWFMINIILILISVIISIAIFSQSARHVISWNPAYYDEADSVKHYENHFFIPILEFYNSRLSEDESVTIGFGVSPFEYLLKRSFIDLNHPRNWLLYLPLFKLNSTDELLNYLEELDARYFLIPTEKYVFRDKYDSALKNSTLFNLIETSKVFTRTDGQMYLFKRLAEFNPFVLYVLERLPY